MIRTAALRVALTALALLPACTAPRATAVRSAPAPGAPVSYDVRFGAIGDTTIADVRARIPVPSGELLMYPEGAERFASGWAHFVSDLEARDTAGRAVQLEPAGPARWMVRRADVVDLSYRVRLLHDREPSKWQFGVKEVAYVRPDFVFTTGKALFVTNLEMPPAVVRIHAPSGRRVLASWSRAPRGSNAFRVSGPLELTESAIVVGSPLVRTVQVGDTRVDVATSRSLPAAAAAVSGHVERFLPAAAALFGATPPDTLLIVAERDSAYVGGGAAFEGAISLMFPDPPGPANRARWGHVLDHEIVHLWIGYRLRYPDEAPEYWFSEGFTDYATWMLEAAHELVASDTLRHVFHERFEAYRRQAGSASMHAVSAEKARYYDLIYGGGLLVALALDVELRARTNLERGMPDVLRALYAEFGGSGSARYTAEDVVRVVNATCACDLRPFFTAHVFGTTVLPVESIVARLGLASPDASGSATARAEHADPETRRLHAAWLAGWRTSAVRR